MRYILAVLIFGGAFVAAAARADANVHFCNATPLPVSVAIAMQWTNAIGASYQAVEGWYTIEGGQCETPLPFDPSMRSLAFYYAANSHDDTWDKLAEPRSYCVNELESFRNWNSFEETTCEPPASKREFRHILTGRNDQTVVFLAPDASLSI